MDLMGGNEVDPRRESEVDRREELSGSKVRK